MVKSKIVEVEEKAEAYPCLKINIISDIVVLFKSKHIGVVVYQKNSNYKVGYINNFWTSESFIPFDGEIKLSNKI